MSLIGEEKCPCAGILDRAGFLGNLHLVMMKVIGLRLIGYTLRPLKYVSFIILPEG
ncbi:hypothetical protein D3C84_1087220 [compost metagenome]